MMITIALLCIIVIIGFFIFLNQNRSKINKIGNNSSSQEIVDYILAISSYEAQIQVEVKSNKNTNQYKIKQTYINPDNNDQEIIEPSNLQGVKIKREGNHLTIENSQLNLTTLYENYQEVTENNLDLSSFIKDYQNNQNAKWTEEQDLVKMETTLETTHPYTKSKTLYVDKKTGNPVKMEIRDTNQNVIIYIIYNEVKISDGNPKDVVAFQPEKIEQQIV